MSSDLVYGQQREMEDRSMVGTLHAQAEMIWPLERPVLEQLGVTNGERIADLGCGTGQFAGRLAVACPGARITGLDLFEGHLARARAEFPETTHPNLSFVHGDARKTGWKSGAFDVVTLRHFLHALPQPEDVLMEARRILEPGGMLYLLAEDYQGLIFDAPSYHDFSLFNEAAPTVLAKGTDLLHGRTAYRALRAAGFDGVRVTPILVDTENTDRQIFATMLRHWRDGYARFLAEGLGVEPRAVSRRFDALMLTVLDTDRYSCWLLFAVTGRKPSY